MPWASAREQVESAAASPLGLIGASTRLSSSMLTVGERRELSTEARSGSSAGTPMRLSAAMIAMVSDLVRRTPFPRMPPAKASDTSLKSSDEATERNESSSSPAVTMSMSIFMAVSRETPRRETIQSAVSTSPHSLRAPTSATNWRASSMPPILPAPVLLATAGHLLERRTPGANELLWSKGSDAVRNGPSGCVAHVRCLDPPEVSALARVKRALAE